ncbi:MAG: metallophosphoesterase [Deltaproteobacteria bacterium]|nr:metallophosphoesterase [Deltaproteobacteria bacterium]
MTKIPTMEDFVACADLHIHSKVPKNRKGDYYGQVLTKFGHLLRLTAKYSIPKLLVVAGDFFDAPNVPYKVANKVMAMIKESEVHIMVVPGQHDLRYHVSGLENTPLGVLQTSGQVEILTPKMSKTTYGGVSFVGAGWNEEPEEEADVLVMHRMVTKKGELWPGQTNYSTAHAIMRKYPWAECIITGDNHLPHALRWEGRLQINCGSMVRSTKSQIGFQPRCWLVDTSTWKTKPLKIPCLPDEEVFDFNKITIEEMKEDAKAEAEAKIAEFIGTLPKNDKERPNFKKILGNVVDFAKPKTSVKNIINETMERVSA